MARLIIFNKPFNVLTQFTDQQDRTTLADYIPVKNVYPAGRLDRDSEGLLLLTDDGALQHRISHPRHKLEKRYWAQVEGTPDERALQQLREGVQLKDGLTAPARVNMIDEPDIWPRDPPIRYRANIPTSWLELTISEGRNRQVRRMVRKIGNQVAGLKRIRVANIKLGRLARGAWRHLSDQEKQELFRAD